MRAVILGCGYVGCALAEEVARRGHDVIGVTRSDEGIEAIESAGVRAIQADVTVPGSLAQLPDIDWVVFAVSAGGGPAAVRSNVITGLETALETLSPHRLVYTSSTGVYGDHDGGWVTEETPIAPVGEKAVALAEAERVTLGLAREQGIDPIVARLSGVYGPGRYRIDRYLSGPITPGYRNCIHREDVAGAIAHLLEQGTSGHDIVLVSDDEPHERVEFASWLADTLGTDRAPIRENRPTRSDRARRRTRTSKRCDNARLRHLGYELHYPTYREGYQAALDRHQNDS